MSGRGTRHCFEDEFARLSRGRAAPSSVANPCFGLASCKGRRFFDRLCSYVVVSERARPVTDLR